MTKLNIGLFGYGCVGSGLFQVLKQTPDINVHISKICVKNQNKQRDIAPSYFTSNKNELLDDPEINIIVELIDDPEAAYHIVKTALRKGKAVVTANKKWWLIISQNYTFYNNNTIHPYCMKLL